MIIIHDINQEYNYNNQLKLLTLFKNIYFSIIILIFLYFLNNSFEEFRKRIFKLFQHIRIGLRNNLLVSPICPILLIYDVTIPYNPLPHPHIV